MDGPGNSLINLGPLDNMSRAWTSWYIRWTRFGDGMDAGSQAAWGGSPPASWTSLATLEIPAVATASVTTTHFLPAHHQRLPGGDADNWLRSAIRGIPRRSISTL